MKNQLNNRELNVKLMRSLLPVIIFIDFLARDMQKKLINEYKYLFQSEIDQVLLKNFKKLMEKRRWNDNDIAHYQLLHKEIFDKIDAEQKQELKKLGRK